jgi:DNA adenine methylase
MNKLFAYPGGKWPIRTLIVSCFPKHETFVDVFGGSASILITKEPSRGEIFNDKNEEIVNFFRVVKHRPAELAERAKHWIHSRVLWMDQRAMAVPKDEVERAFRFWVITADSFGAIGGTFGTARSGMHSVTHARAYLDEVSKRLRDVHIENLDFRKCIKMYDGPSTFFYLDPPYRGTHGGDNHYDSLDDKEWSEMAEMLGNLRGKFLLSHTNDPFVLQLFKGYFIKHIQVRVTLSKSQSRHPREEILISNYRLPNSRSTAHSRYRKDRESMGKDATRVSAKSRSTVQQQQSQPIVHRKAMHSLAGRRGREKLVVR